MTVKKMTRRGFLKLLGYGFIDLALLSMGGIVYDVFVERGSTGHREPGTGLKNEGDTKMRFLLYTIGGEAQLSGVDRPQALLDFLEFAGKGPFVAFRAEFDRIMVERACKEELAFRPAVPWVDVAVLLPALLQTARCDTLDEWLAHFNLEAFDRHDALCDAWATAELFLIALAAADRMAMGTAGDLLAMQKAQRWLGVRR